jgi:tRNA dimethylallyltransferase
VTTKPRALCLAGPTASGKSALAFAFATQAGPGAVEIVSVDSAQVYRGMDIGTAKPSAAERAAVPHHLIDILDPSQAYSAARFAADARARVAEINARGALALLVGGTMLYFKALREGLDVLPESDPETRAALDAEAAVRGWPALHAELARVDPASAARLAPTDAQRIQRALEVHRISGRPLSAWQAGPRKADDARWPLLALEPAARAWLHARIARRFEAMLAEGLVDEVQRLRARGDLHPALPSMRCVGYRQAWAALDEGRLDTLAERGIAATRQLAKRQLTWLRSLPTREVLACDGDDALRQGLSVLRRLASRLAD